MGTNVDFGLLEELGAMADQSTTRTEILCDTQVSGSGNIIIGGILDICWCLLLIT